MTIYTSAKELMSYVFSSPDRDRLAGAISETWVDLDTQICLGGDLTQPWARAAYQFLLHSESYLADWDLQQGWIALRSAQRALLSSPSDSGRIERAEIALRREAEKITGWRAKAIEDLIGSSKGKFREKSEAESAGKSDKHDKRDIPPKSDSPDDPGKKDQGDKSDEPAKAQGPAKDQRDKPKTDEPEKACVLAALDLRDDRYHTDYFKILMRRRHLFQLFLILWISITLCLILSYFKFLPPPLNGTKLVAAVVLFGVLGACLSVAQGLLAAKVSDKIPAQQIGSFVVWMRPAIGAAAALIALVLLHANETFKIFNWKVEQTGLIIAIAFVAGYSERFIVGAIERISPTDE